MDKRKIVVLGAGESGTGAAILAHDKGMDVFLSDYGTVAPRYAAMLDAEGIGWEQGGHSMDRILAADEIVKSPGIADSTPVMKAVRERGIPVVSEIELAARYFPEGTRTVCITGSNGKTTTTMLTHHILRRAGIDASEAGYIGRSLALQVAREPHDVYVIELSSFQLDNMYDFRADTAIITNITPDHLDRYDYKMENYVAAKMRILQNMRPCDTFISWADDPVVALRSELQATQARRLEFAIRQRADGCRRAFAARRPQPPQQHGRGSGGIKHGRLPGSHSRGTAHVCSRGAPSGACRHRRWRALDQRLQGHQRKFLLLCPRSHDHTHRADTRRQGQRQRLQ